MIRKTLIAGAVFAVLALFGFGGATTTQAGPGAGVNCDPVAPVPIPDSPGPAATVDCTVENGGIIKDLDVAIGITHTFKQDLVITVTHVDTGTSATLWNQNCGGNDNIAATFDDEGAPLTCPVGGAVQPQTPLSAFDGEKFHGTWRLTADDNIGIDTGTIDSFRLFATVNQGVLKVPTLANLWLCNQPATTCENKASGVEAVNLDVNLQDFIDDLDPKCVGFPNFADPATCDSVIVGSFEFEVRYDAKFVDVDVLPGEIWRDANVGVQCDSIEGEGFEQFRCNVKGKTEAGGITGPGNLAIVHVTPTADVYSILVANQLNGIATQLINQDCQLSDDQGHPIAVTGELCGDAAITIRYLEGDVHADCVIDVRDQQQIAFRWGSALGQLLYNSRYDLEPSYPKATDGDIDAKDLQLVYGRAGSTCKDPHPDQDPVDPKSKEGEPPIGA
jgi:subtilisin-like proprotein convertase family protein